MIEHDLPPMRPTLGDHINPVETQKRLDYVLFYNPNMVRVEYQSTLNSTREYVKEQHELKGLDKGVFRNFGRRTPEQALKLLQIINNNIYGPLFKILGKGHGMVRSVDPHSRHITYEVRNCNECLDLPDVGVHSCFGFAGLLAGIFSALFQQSIGVYESTCGTSGSPVCTYEVVLIRDMAWGDKVDRYLRVKLSRHQLLEIEKTLFENIHRSLAVDCDTKPCAGENIHIIGYQLRLLNVLSQNPEIFSETYRKAGARFSEYLVNILKKHYKVEGEGLLTKALPEYYRKQSLALIHSVDKFEDGYLMTLSESLECAGIKDLSVKPCSFMQGEIEGIATLATGKAIECDIHSCRFDSGKDHCQYRLTFVREERDIPEWLQDIQEKDTPV